MREDRIGRHEGPGGLKPPVTLKDHNRAMRIGRRVGRHEHPVFISSFVEPGKIWIAPAWEENEIRHYAHPSAFGRGRMNAMANEPTHDDQAKRLVELLHSTERAVALGLMSKHDQRRRILEALPPPPPLPRAGLHSLDGGAGSADRSPTPQPRE